MIIVEIINIILIISFFFFFVAVKRKEWVRISKFSVNILHSAIELLLVFFS